MNKKPWAHFVAVCGPTVGSIAILLKNQGWKITGSDSGIYPPASEYLQKHGINILEGFEAKRIDKDIDLVVLGGGAMIMDKKNPEVTRALSLNIKTISWPQLIAEKLVCENSLVVAGTYGKTTITAMVTWILKNAGWDPSYLIGGYPVNFEENVKLGKSSYSVVEGDEHPSVLYFDDRSKFMYYKPKYVLLTSARWDHFNIFRKERDYVQAFINFVKLIPENGLLVLCKNGENLEKIASFSKCKVIWYSEEDFGGRLEVVGRFNRENAAGALTLSGNLGVPEKAILKSLSTFKGVKRRLEKKFETANTIVIEDFAQHPYKVKEVLETLRESYPERKIILVFDPFASILRSRESLHFYNKMFNKADEVFLRRVKVALVKEKRVTGPEIISAMDLPKGVAKYLPLDEHIIEEVVKLGKNQKAVLVFCSSGGWNGLIEKVRKRLS
jgi:UDP-N-acetylmuramate: L-alanyl-gamma-D-glutamyl-meso-diaminopimelate ligase